MKVGISIGIGLCCMVTAVALSSYNYGFISAHVWSGDSVSDAPNRVQDLYTPIAGYTSITQSGLTFEYPSHFSVTTNGPMRTEIMGDDGFFLYVSTISVEEKSLEAYLEMIDEAYSIEVAEKPVGVKGDESTYQLITTTINDVEAIYHTRNFSCATGEVSQLYVWAGGGTIVIFHTDGYKYHEQADAIFESVRKIVE